MNLPGNIRGSVGSTGPHLPFGTRSVDASLDQFGNIRELGGLGHVGRLDRFGNVSDILGRTIGHVNQFGNIGPR